MPSSYSPDLRIELIANGEKTGTWGTITNDNLGVIIEDAISALASVSVTSANQALTAQNGAADQARCAALSLTTTTAANFAVYVPPVTKLYVVTNPSGYTATVYASTVLGNTTAAGAGVAIPTGKSVLLRVDNTNAPTVNVVEQLNHFVNNMSFGGNISVTGTATFVGVPSGPTAAPGTNTTQLATTAFVTATTSALGTMSTQNANAVAITGGTMSGMTSIADTIGNVRNIPINSKTASYVLLVGDAGQVVSITTGGVTVPSGVFSAGQAVSIYNNSATSQTITQGGGTTMTLASSGLTGNRTLGGYGLCTVLCIASNTFVITGAGIS
jgi:hypothetical protein